jgi:hypothetical protein
VTAPVTAPVVFLDTETTGLDRASDDIWEFAAVRRDRAGVSTWYCQVEHDLAKAAQLPDRFRADHDARYDPDLALTRDQFTELIGRVFETPDGAGYHERPHVVGAVPDFDLTIIERVIGRHGNDVPWHHHIADVENLAAGYLQGVIAGQRDHRRGLGLPDREPFPSPPWDSEALSRAIGVDPDQYSRHTAMGDVLWAMAIYDTVMGATR